MIVLYTVRQSVLFFLQLLYSGRFIIRLNVYDISSVVTLYVMEYCIDLFQDLKILQCKYVIRIT